jgi:formamidopyrimidine-DNA glycosylase
MLPGGDLTVDDIERLLVAVAAVLGAAIENGGTSLEDMAYLLPDGRAGDNLERLRVYGRTGMPCPECGAPVERVVIRARSSHFCPVCQPAP